MTVRDRLFDLRDIGLERDGHDERLDADAERTLALALETAADVLDHPRQAVLLLWALASPPAEA